MYKRQMTLEKQLSTFPEKQREERRGYGRAGVESQAGDGKAL